jgi:hypothetical protein
VAGRFLQTDPVGYTADNDLYAYVGEDPLDQADPTGNCPKGSNDNGYGCVEPATKEDHQQQQQFAKTREESAKSSGAEGAAKIALVGIFGPLGGLEAGGAEAVEAGAEAGTEATTAGAEASTDAGAEAGAEQAGGRAAQSSEQGGSQAARRACCFVAGTLVTTKAGLRPIEAIALGDLVLSRNVETGVTAYKRVDNLVRLHNRETYVLSLETLEGGVAHQSTFETTDDHPWRTVFDKWVQTVDLRPGDLLMRAHGAAARVVSVRKTGRTAATFNLEVADFHTYFVGEDQVWVHNEDCGPPKTDLSNTRAHTGSPAETPSWGAPKPPRPGGSPNPVGSRNPPVVGSTLSHIINLINTIWGHGP